MDARIKSAEKANAVPPSALLYNRKNGLYISKHRTGVGHKMENVVTGNATARAYEPRYIRLNANDNVAIGVNDLGLPAKTRFPCGLELRSFVPQGHKVALADIAEGASIRRYNEVIGTAAQPILAGEWVDEARICMPMPPELDKLELSTSVPAPQAPLDGYTFDGLGAIVEARMGRADARLALPHRRRRETCPVSDLVVGLQCGGSDAFSGVTANPALGFAADLLVRAGAAVMFSEVTEVRDAIHLLTRRAATEDVGRALIREMDWYDRYLAKGDADRSANTTPGNKKAGLPNIVQNPPVPLLK